MATVDLPEPDKPVSQSTPPRWPLAWLRSSSDTLLKDVLHQPFDQIGRAQSTEIVVKATRDDGVRRFNWTDES